MISINRSSEDLNKNRKPDLAILADPGLKDYINNFLAKFLVAFADKISRTKNNLWSHWMQELALVEKASDQKIETGNLPLHKSNFQRRYS